MTQPISRARTWASERRGFTLVEILVVLVIVSIGFGMVVFSVTSRPADQALGRQAEALAGWIRSATARAAERGEGLTLVYDLEGGTFGIEATDRSSGRSEIVLIHRIAAPVRLARIACVRDEVLVVDQGECRAAVFPRGTCEPHLVTLSQEGVGERTLEVNPITGDVEVFKGAREYERVDAGQLFAEAAAQGRLHAD